MNKYIFNPELVFMEIERHWSNWRWKTGCGKFLVGVSGGIDSTTCLALAKRIFGEDCVCGISMPCGTQSDMADVDRVFEHTGIRRLDFNIEDAVSGVIDGIARNSVAVSNQTRTNLPARIRMATLYAFAQSLGMAVVNTCNLSESISGWDTLFGDDCGSYAPIQNLTKTEVRALAAWMGVPPGLVNKTPVDGLQPKTDEEGFGYTYAELDRLIREGKCAPEVRDRVFDRYMANGKFKMDMIRIDGPDFGFPNFVRG